MNGVKMSSRVTILVICLLLASTIASRAFANFTYTYTGNSFTDIYNTTSTPLISISGSFTITSQLPANQSSYWITLTTYTFTDGSFTLDQANSSGVAELQTDAAGNITGWNVQVAGWYNGDDTLVLQTAKGFTGTVWPACDYSRLFVTATGVTLWQAHNTNSPGTWTVQ